MKSLLILATLSLTLSFASGCFTGDYPHDEPSTTCPDNHKSGPGTYGGTTSPLDSDTQAATNPSK